MINAKVDTGAKTSSLHAYAIKEFERDGKPFVEFKLHPIQHTNKIPITCEAPLVDQRQVTNSGGKKRERYVIKTLLKIGGKSWPIEMTLNNRKTMSFRMLLGRQALKSRFRINAGKTYLLGKRTKSEVKEVYTNPTGVSL